VLILLRNRPGHDEPRKKPQPFARPTANPNSGTATPATATGEQNETKTKLLKEFPDPR
jgi:hypothetical protein